MNEAALLPPILKKSDVLNNMAGIVDLPQDDATNASLFAQAYRGSVLYVNAQWWVYHDVKGKWIPDPDRVIVRRLAVDVGIARRESVGFSDKAREALRWATYSLSASGIRAELELAGSEPELIGYRDDFDSNPDMVLDAAGNCIDLITGHTRPATPDDRFTRSLNAIYNPCAACPLWERFITESFEDDIEAILFFRRWLGYSLTGRTVEGKVLVSVGPGGNGKGVASSTVEKIFGDYGRTISSKLFAPSSGSNGPAYEVAELPGVRGVFVRETPEDGHFDESLFKSATGEDVIPARAPYARPFTFRPVFKLSIETNHAPRVRSQNFAMWRRLLRLDWKHTPKNPDMNLREKLLAESSGILSWIVQGSVDWYQSGLQPPDAVQVATNLYRDTQDVLKDFLEQFQKEPDASIGAGDLYTRYRMWAESNGLRTMSSPSLKEAMTERGFKHERGKTGSRYIGLRG